MPLFNKAVSVMASVASIQAQTVADWELVVVDDGSTDAGPDLVRAVPDSRIRVYSQANEGVSAARNWGIDLAITDLVTFLDADDRWHPDFLETILALARDFPEAQWFATGYEIRDPRQGVFNARLRGTPTGFERGLLVDYFQVAMQSDPPVWTSAMAVRHHAIQAIGGFPVGIYSGEDLLTWARLAVRFPLAYDRRSLAVFEVSGYDRRADPEQRVSLALGELVRDYPLVKGGSAYLGLWCRMQAVMAMRFADIVLARRCAWRSVQYGPTQWRNAYTLLLVWLPSPWRILLDAALRHMVRK